jgi:hypothetical protein
MSKKTKKDKYIERKIPILTGSYFDLTKFDFSFKDISIYDVESKEFKKYLEKLNPELKNYDVSAIHNREEVHYDFEKQYAIVKNNPHKSYNNQDLINVWILLLIIYPSDLQIGHILYLDEVDNFFEISLVTVYKRKIHGDYPGELLIAIDNDIPIVNEFSKLYFDRLNLSNYIGIAIENYLSSFSSSHYHYAYLTLCIALESIIAGNQELTYRLRRTVAILCGKDTFNCENIYKNLSKLYGLRSKIIHGEYYKIEKVKEYLKPLRAIVSRTIIELLIHNIPTNIELNDFINKLGYGDRTKITDTWIAYDFNINTIVDTNWKSLK